MMNLGEILKKLTGSTFLKAILYNEILWESGFTAFNFLLVKRIKIKQYRLVLVVKTLPRISHMTWGKFNDLS